MNEYLIGLNLSHEEKIFAAHIEDLVDIGQKKNIPVFSGFLDLRRQMIAKAVADGVCEDNYYFFGGFEEAERKIFGVFPDYISDENSQFPFVILKVFHSRELSHRDFLGAIMSLGIKREVLGDIIVGQNESFIVIIEKMSGFVIDNLSKIANVGVKLEVCDADKIILSQERFSDENTIVSSFRTDCVVSALSGKSRAEVSNLISAEKVFVNHQTATSCSKTILEGDVVSVRSVGKFKIGKTISQTKKGRYVLSYKKYI